MRPLLLPALRRLWRDPTTLQLGVDPTRAVLVTGVGPATAVVLELLDGRRTLGDLSAEAERHGIPAAAVGELVGALRVRGAVVDGELARALPMQLSGSERRRLRPDLAALSLSVGAEAGAVLAQRARRQVEVRARGRIGPVVASLLAASGVGRVHVRASGVADAADAAVGGLLPEDEHRPYATAAAASVHRAAPEADTRPIAAQRAPDVIVLADGPVGGRPVPVRRGEPALLPVGVRDGTAVIGPFVVPGRSACLQCVERHRCDRDPAWPALSAQLATSAARRPEPCEAVLATTAAGIAAMQVLNYLDGQKPAALGRSLELTGLSGRIRSRSWPRHPACPCRLTDAAENRARGASGTTGIAEEQWRHDGHP
jgi:bacteriocin biosynthesis cyclodehydratase domain-containing protein